MAKTVEDAKVNVYIEWAQKVCRNLSEYNYILSIRDSYDKDLIITNVNLFLDVQSLLKIKTPHIDEVSFEKILEYVYLNRIYFDIWYEGYSFNHSFNEQLMIDAEIKRFIRLHFDSNGKKLNGSSMDKVVYWIKDGNALDPIVQTLKHYYDHKKMYDDSGIFLENLTCEAFLKLSEAKSFIVFKYSHMIQFKLTDEIRQEISSDPDLTKLFSKLVQDYIKNHKNAFNVELFDKTMSKIKNYNNRTREFLIQLSNSLNGFDFDIEVEQVKRDVETNRNLRIVVETEDLFIYQIADYETLRIYSSPHWCISRSLSQYERYISRGDMFYVVLQRNPTERFNYKTGVTMERNNYSFYIKHSFNYADAPNRSAIEKFVPLLQVGGLFSKMMAALFKKKKTERVENDEAPMPNMEVEGEHEEMVEDVMAEEDTRVQIMIPRRRA